jgi:hypothetical protein
LSYFNARRVAREKFRPVLSSILLERLALGLYAMKTAGWSQCATNPCPQPEMRLYQESKLKRINGDGSLSVGRLLDGESHFFRRFNIADGGRNPATAFYRQLVLAR